MRRVLALASLVAFFGCSTSDEPAGAESASARLPALGMNDVSVLFPLPASGSAAGYLGPSSAGARGELLPKAVYDEIPTFPVKTAQRLDLPLMRAVAVRFDGCFPGKEGCEAQIRLVMQPIDANGSTRDSALHLFYRLTEPELAEIVGRLRELRALAPETMDAPLDVHPALVAQGVEGPYGAGLTELVLRYAGEENLSRMTFFLRAPPATPVWFFGGFDRASGSLSQLDIVGVGKGNQRVIFTETPDGYNYELTPTETKPESTNALLSSEAAKTAPRAEVEATYAAFLRIENPETYGPDALPCAGCHVATVVTAFAEASLGFDAKLVPDAFTSKRDLTVLGDAAATPKSLRAFGWFGARPMISRRVVNESAAVVDDLERRFPAAP